MKEHCKEMFKICSSLNINLKNWNTDDVISMVPVKNKKYKKYAKENNLNYWFEPVIGKVLIMASKSSHPKLFDGSLD